jgi:uncharacterized radical SAM superfamily Fe-S cluster-containing enzyme
MGNMEPLWSSSRESEKLSAMFVTQTRRDELPGTACRTLTKGRMMASLPRPLALVAELTYRCPLHCPYWSNPLELARYRHELDTAAWQRVLTEAAHLGVVQVHFSGGDPLVRRDLVESVYRSSPPRPR